MKHNRPASSGASHARAALTVTGAILVLTPHARRVAAKVRSLRAGTTTVADVVKLAVNPTASCRHCGQELTDIVTAIGNLGYGPTCVTRVP
jgi:hypothetical protein